MGFSKKQIQERFNSIIPKDFKTHNDSGGITYTKKIDERILYIHLTYTGYPDMYRINQPMAGIGFEAVEQILKEANEIIFKIIFFKGETINYYRIKNELIDYSTFDLILKEHFEFDIIESELHKSIELGALPFFERFDSLEKVSKFIDLENISKNIHEFIPGLTPIKLLLIKILSNDTGWENYYLEQKEWYHSEVYNYPQHFKDHDKLFDFIFVNKLGITL